MLFKIPLDKLKYPPKIEVGILLIHFFDFEVHIYVVTCNRCCHFSIYYEV